MKDFLELWDAIVFLLGCIAMLVVIAIIIVLAFNGGV